jgi:hypothetical protein
MASTIDLSLATGVRAHSKIVNQCVFNSLLPWYVGGDQVGGDQVGGDFVVHLAGLKGVWECLFFWYYFEVWRCRFRPRVDRAWFQRLNLNYDDPLSSCNEQV